MPRKAVYSCHYKLHNWRASQVRNAGVIEDNTPVSEYEWKRLRAAVTQQSSDGSRSTWSTSHLRWKP